VVTELKENFKEHLKGFCCIILLETLPFMRKEVAIEKMEPYNVRGKAGV
jgi:hypothetical protein